MITALTRDSPSRSRNSARSSAVVGRPPHARALVEDLDRVAAALAAAFDRLREAAGCGDVGADQHRRDPRETAEAPLRPLARPGRCTSAAPAPHCTTGSPPRGSGGWLVLRIEDTDRERSTPENVEQILDALRWLELDWDEGPLRQAERAPAHRAALGRLLESGRRLPRRRDRQGRRGLEGATRRRQRLPRHADDDPAAAVRLRVPDEGETVVDDLIRGPVPSRTRSQDDFVIARGDGSVLYNFAVAVDDAEMGITDVVRGDDHLSNTPKQLLVLEALGHAPPRYAHLPLLHGPDGKKLSKRHGAASVQELREAGYLPAAVRNYLALLGWGTDDDTTLMSTDGAGRPLPGRATSAAPAAIFDEQKLRWLNGRFMRELPLPEYEATLAAPSRPHRPGRARRSARRRRSASRGLRDRPGEGADRGRDLALDRLPVHRAGARRGVWKKVMKPSVAELLAAGLEALRGTRRERLDRRGARGRAAGADGGARGRRPQAAPTDPGRDQRLERLPGHLRVARRARPRPLFAAHTGGAEARFWRRIRARIPCRAKSLGQNCRLG